MSTYEDLRSAIDDLDRAATKLEQHKGQAIIYDALKEIRRARHDVESGMLLATEYEPEAAP